MAVNLLDLSYPRGAGAARGPSAGTVGPGVARGRPLDGLEIDSRGLTFVETQLGGEEPERFPLGLAIEDRLACDKDLRLGLFGVHARVIGGGVPMAHPTGPGSRRGQV